MSSPSQDVNKEHNPATAELEDNNATSLTQAINVITVVRWDISGGSAVSPKSHSQPTGAEAMVPLSTPGGVGSASSLVPQGPVPLSHLLVTARVYMMYMLMTHMRQMAIITRRNPVCTKNTPGRRETTEGNGFKAAHSPTTDDMPYCIELFQDFTT